MTALHKSFIVIGWALFLWFIVVGPLVMAPANSAEVLGVPSATVSAGLIMWKAEKYNMAIDIWSELAENGNEKASWMLFAIYSRNTPVGAADMKKAIKWLEKLSEANVADARELLGDLYYYGRGVSQSYRIAAEWYAEYIKLEQDPDIMTRYAILLATGQGTEEDKLKAFKLLYVAGEEQNYIQAYLIASQVFNDMSPVEQFMARSFIQRQRQKHSN